MDSELDPRLQLEPVSGRSRLWLLFLTVVLPVSLSLVLPLLAGGNSATARLIDDSLATSRWLDQLFGPLLVAAITSLVWFVLDRLAHRHRLQFNAGGLEIATTFYRQKLAFSELQLEAARVISIDEHPELKPMLKSNGMALPGFRSGWFRSRALKKLFVATAGGEQLLWLPTRRGHSLLLQPRQPRVLLQRLRELAAGTPRR
ncbi:MAG: hypothetical protein ACREO7_04555 [Pseudoxanthomonas sp.]